MLLCFGLLAVLSVPVRARDLRADESPACRQAAAIADEGKRKIAQKNFDDGIRQFGSALALCPASSVVKLELARAYLTARRFREGEQTAKEVLASDPRSESAQFLVAYSYFMQQRFQEAGRILLTLLAQDNMNYEAHKLMGLNLFFYKEYVTAEQELLTALRGQPDDQEALYYLGRIYYTQNNFGPAAATFQRLIALAPQSYKAYDNLGLCYEALGKTDEALSAFKKAQEIARALDPAYDWPYSNMAALLLKENRFGEALVAAREAVRLNSKSARNNYLVGKGLTAKGGLLEGVSYLRKAAELDPDDPEPHYLLGRTYQKLGQQAEAEHEYALFEKLSKNRKNQESSATSQESE